MDRPENYFKIFTSFEEQFDLLNNEELGELVRALLSYSKTGEEPKNMSPLLKMAFAFVNSYNSSNTKRGAPVGNANAKKTNKNNSETIENNSKTNKNNSKQFENNSKTIQNNSKTIQNNSKTIQNNSKTIQNNSAELNLIDFSAEKPPNVDNFVDNSVDNFQNTNETLDDYDYKQNYSFVSLVCSKEKDYIYNNMRASARVEDRQKCIDTNSVLLKRKFADVIRHTKEKWFATSIVVAIDAFAHVLTEPPNKNYTVEQIHSWINELTDDEFTKICELIKVNGPIRKPNIYILKCLENISKDKTEEIEVVNDA